MAECKKQIILFSSYTFIFQLGSTICTVKGKVINQVECVLILHVFISITEMNIDCLD